MNFFFNYRIDSICGPQAFRVEVMEALRSLVENGQLRAELLETLSSDAAAQATELLEKNNY